MKSMILKIFLAYWFAAGIILLVNDFGPNWTPHNPVLTNALNVSLILHGRTLINAYQAGKCNSDLLSVNDSTDGIYLATADGRIVCGDLQQSGIDELVARTVQSHKRKIANYRRFLVFAIPITDSRGTQYVLLIKNHYQHQSQIYVQRPGNTAIAISCVVTFLLAVLIVYPIRRLRTVTHQIASGNLEARLKTGWFSRLMIRLHLTDDLDRLMDDFNKMAERLQSAVAAQQLLLRDVTHELRSPLSRITVALGCSRESDPSAVHIHLDRIESESIRLNNLIAQILAFSYIESISELRHTSVLSLNKIVQDLLPDVQYEAESRDCRIFTTCMRETLVNGDSDMIRHAIENIVRNAIRYSPSHGIVEIHIDTEEYDHHNMAVVSVTDTGPGVSEDELKLILNPFYRAQKFHHGSTSGFGVGLAIADRAAHLHGGEIVARNKKDGGLIIDMFLPLSV